MGAIESQITSLTIVYSAVYSGAVQRKHRSSALLAFVRGIHRFTIVRSRFLKVQWNYIFAQFSRYRIIRLWDNEESGLNCKTKIQIWIDNKNITNRATVYQIQRYRPIVDMTSNCIVAYLLETYQIQRLTSAYS